MSDDFRGAQYELSMTSMPYSTPSGIYVRPSVCPYETSTYDFNFNTNCLEEDTYLV